MAINVWEYLKEYEQEKEEIHAAIEKVLNSGRLILGDSVRKFEEEFAGYCDVKFGVGVNSGTDALFLGLKALSIGKGDEVITVANMKHFYYFSHLLVPRFLEDLLKKHFCVLLFYFLVHRVHKIYV